MPLQTADQLSTDPARKQAVSDAIGQISHIATLPEVTLHIIELVENPSSTAQDLHRVISNDPALCSRILKVVNSAFYGLPGQIGSINRAIVLLGLNAVKNIAIAASLSKLYRGGQLTPHFAARDLWVHSIATAATAKVVADTVGLGLPDEAFLGGLVHDIGVMVEMQAERDKLVQILESLDVDGDGAPKKPMLDAEERVLHATHQDYGRGICEKWKFPKSFQYICGWHHNPLELAESNRTLACVVHIADRLTARHNMGFRLDVPDTGVAKDILDAVKLSTAQLEELSSSLPEKVEGVERLLS